MQSLIFASALHVSIHPLWHIPAYLQPMVYQVEHFLENVVVHILIPSLPGSGLLKVPAREA